MVGLQSMKTVTESHVFTLPVLTPPREVHKNVFGTELTIYRVEDAVSGAPYVPRNHISTYKHIILQQSILKSPFITITKCVEKKNTADAASSTDVKFISETPVIL